MQPGDDKRNILRRYLLGGLNQDDQLKFECELMTDKDALEQVAAAEDELIEEYLENSLSAQDRADFEKHFLSAPERRQELQLAKALRRYVTTQKKAAKIPFWESLLAPLRTQPAFLKQALVAMLALTVVGGTWSARQAWRSNQEIAQIRDQQRSSQDQLETLRRQLTEQRSSNLQLAEALQRREELSSSSIPAAAQPPVLVALALTPGLVRDSGMQKKIAIPSGTTGIKLQLDVASPDYRSYRVVLQDSNGEEITTQSKLQASKLADHDVVVVTLPATLVPPDDYSLKLSGRTAAGDFEDLGRYYFRVTRN